MKRQVFKPKHRNTDLETCAITQKHGMTRRDFLRSAAATAGMLVVPWPGTTAQAQVASEQRQRIEAAIPNKAIVPPRKNRKLLIFGLNVGYGGHGSIPTANMAFT
ncbi:MAG: twin-arginine translocation signal domain-containing protein, partial [Sedimentisphaerales bacterium]